MQKNKSNIVVYNDGELELKISVNDETIWLTQAQICNIFEKDQSVISRHINNIFKDEEVDGKSNMQKMHIANSDKPVSFYSLDIVLAVGYRTNSSKAIRFRQWATSILKNYIQNAYVINGEKITNDRFLSLEKEVIILKQYENIELYEFKNSHDRFLIIDKKEVLHIGASLKDLGKKWFAFSKFDIENLKILEYLR
jgi:prophage antirepressor-like protein